MLTQIGYRHRFHYSNYNNRIDQYLGNLELLSNGKHSNGGNADEFK